MLFFIFSPVWVAILSLMYIWGLDPSGPIMETSYVIAGLTTFFATLISAP